MSGVGFHLTVIGAVLSIAGCEREVAGPDSDQVAPSAAVTAARVKIAASLLGAAHSDALNGDILIAALKLSDGTVLGETLVPGGVSGKVIKLVPPSTAHPHWCLTFALGTNDFFNWYVRDIGDGKSTFDELSFSAGENLTCTEAPAPPTQPFAPVTRGNYLGKF